MFKHIPRLISTETKSSLNTNLKNLRKYLEVDANKILLLETIWQFNCTYMYVGNINM